MNRTTLGLAAGLLLATSAVVLACSSSTDTTSTRTPTGTQSTAASVAGAADTHCAGKPIVVVDPAACNASESDAGHTHEEDAGVHEHDGGAEEGKGAYGETQYGSEGEDHECKYHVKWTSSPVTKDADVTLVVVATKRADSSPAAAAEPYAEIFLNETKAAPDTPVQTTETSPGNYTIGPVRFDQSGKWTVRFHFSAGCNDGETSPHGHAAFFLNVP